MESQDCPVKNGKIIVGVILVFLVSGEVFQERLVFFVQQRPLGPTPTKEQRPSPFEGSRSVSGERGNCQDTSVLTQESPL